MLPISTQVPDRFYPAVERAVGLARQAVLATGHEPDAPEEALGQAETKARAEEVSGPCYLLKIPTIWERAECEAAATARGARSVTPEEFHRVLRDGIRDAVDPGQVEYCLNCLTEFEEEVDALGRGEPAGERFAELAREAERITDAVGLHYEPYRNLLQRQSRASSLSMLLRVQMFVLGAEGEGAPEIERRNGRLTDRSLELILATGDMGLIDQRIMQLMRPDRDAVGNSASPVPSTPPGPAISTAAKTRRTARPGNSSAAPTAETRP